MEKFTVLKGVAASLPMANIDTDMIMPKQFLKTIKRTGLGKGVFYDMRFSDHEKEKPDFLLNQKAFRHSTILLAGKNFGCGSSREHAPWGLLDFGFRCIIAPSFADIFFSNCFKNGILCISLSDKDMEQLHASADGSEFTIDLINTKIILPDCLEKDFQIDETRRYNMLNGLDDIALTLEHLDKIKDFEAQQKVSQPWLYS